VTTTFDLTGWRPELDTPVWERNPVVTAANAQEVYPGVGDPLSFDVNLIAIDNASRTLADRMGLTHTMGLDEWPHIAFFAAYYGHVFINVSTLRDLMCWVPQGDPDALEEQLFGTTRPPGAPPFKPSPRQRLVRVRTLARLIPIIRGLPRALADNNVSLDRYLRGLQRADLSKLDDGALMEELDRALRRNQVTADLHIANTVLSGSNFENLRVFLVRNDIADADAVIADLCTGLKNVESAKPGRELARLAARIRNDETLARLFASGDEAAVLNALRAADEPSVRAFREAFDAFLETYGYRGVRELGLSTHVWAMRPQSVVGLLQSYVERGDAIDPDAALREQVRRRERAMAAVEAQLGGRGRRRLHGLVKAAHRGIEGRELSKSQWVRSTHCIRLLVIETGRRLAERGAIADPNAVFFLRLAEVRELMAGRRVPGIAETSDRRREEQRRCADIETDERFTGRPLPRLRRPETEPEPAGGQELTGIPVSPGRVTAKARVVKELADDIDLEPGEVLVCPFTDAAWTPLFFNAAAVVMDLGGPLSHGSTVAREYGIPAVVNVKTGTRTIRDGQTITVDGTRGVVEL
jgi:pyruvate,water dikinase